MRSELGKNYGQRTRFRAVVDRYGKKPVYQSDRWEDTICFRDERFVENNEIATDHIWFTVGKTIRDAKLHAGDVVEFDARISDYTKGRLGERGLDYKLRNPTAFSKIRAETLQSDRAVEEISAHSNLSDHVNSEFGEAS